MGAFDPPIFFEKGTYIGRLEQRHVRADKQRPTREVRTRCSPALQATSAEAESQQFCVLLELTEQTKCRARP